MVSEDKGEWKLLKVWQCKACKLLIKDGRDVFDHTCNAREIEDELAKLRKIVAEQQNIIEEQKVIIEEKNKAIEKWNGRTDGLENFIKELNSALVEKDNDIKIKDQIIENKKKTIIDLEGIIAEQKKSTNKVIEKVVYLDKNTPKTEQNKSVNNINVDIWQKNDRIKDSKDEGYREEIEVEVFERGKGREKVIIKNGKVIKKPDDIILIGKNSQEGFIVKGVYRN